MLHGFQDIVFWFVLHKEETVLISGTLAMVGMILTALVAGYYSEAKAPIA